MLAMSMITDGLKLAAGGTLRNLLAKWTHTTRNGILSGIAITSVVQSSSTVTIATIGFVNAGLLTLYQALGVIYGANIGTTMTGWLVAIIGFEIKIQAFALPLIGLGMILRMLRSEDKLGAFGTVLAGFGLFFVGIDILKDAFEGIVVNVDLNSFHIPGVIGVLVFFLVGFLMTVFTQSSSAAIAITLTAVMGGFLSLEMAASMVIGANVGTTSTAAIAVIGATPNAKRVAAAHVAFNLLTGVVALLLLPLMFILIRSLGQAFELDNNPAVTLALFHTVFNVLGVLLMWPLSKRLSEFLLKRFRTMEETEGAPKYLDDTVAFTPSLALNALTFELNHISSIARRMVYNAYNIEYANLNSMQADHDAVARLVHTCAEFITKIQRSTLTKEVVSQIPYVLNAMQRLTIVSELSLQYARSRRSINLEHEPELASDYQSYISDAISLIDMANTENMSFSRSDLEEKRAALHEHYRTTKTSLLTAASRHSINMGKMSLILEQLNAADRIAKQLERTAVIISDLLLITSYPVEAATEKQTEQQTSAP